MKVKGKNILHIFFTFLPLILAVISLHYLPDFIPVHYGINGKVTRWGSKYETLIISILGVLCCGISLIFTDYVSKKTNNRNKIKNLKVCNMMLIFIFNILTVSFLISDFGKITNINNTFSSKVIYVSLGIAFMMLGSYLPKLKVNNLFGMKRLSDDDIWFNAHKKIGRIFMIFGAIFIMLSLFISSNMLMIILVASLIVITIVVSIYPNK